MDGNPRNPRYCAGQSTVRLTHAPVAAVPCVGSLATHGRITSNRGLRAYSLVPALVMSMLRAALGE